MLFDPRCSRSRWLALTLVLLGMVALTAPVRAQDEAPAAAPADDEPAAAPADDEPAAAPADDEPAAAPADDEPGESGGDADRDGVSAAAEDDARDVAVQTDEDGEPYIEADADGDGKVTAEELAAEQEFDTAFADIPDEVSSAALDQRPEVSELSPSIGIEAFRKLVRLAKRKVLGRMEAKIQQKADARMQRISNLVFLFSLTGLLLLASPLVLRRRYPGQLRSLMAYAALAAGTFVITVNLFGAMMLGLRASQSALARQTNPQLKIAGGFFDALDENAPRYVVTGKELFAPTLEALNGKSDAQPAVLLLENGQKIVKQASVFKTIAGWFKRVNFIFGVLPVLLLGVTLLLFIVAIKPTLIEIIQLPATAAAGAARAGREVVGRVLRRVGGELLATLCTLGVLIVLTLMSGFVMGRVVQPALDTLITCFARGVDYLQFVGGASTGKVTLMLASVILFLVLNLAVVIASMSFFLGKSQKIFQQRFNEGVPLLRHARWWRWAILSVVGAQLLPLVYLFIARFMVASIERRIMAASLDAEKINWTQLMLASPLVMVLGFVAFFWAARGVKAMLFMARYQVKLPANEDPAQGFLLAAQPAAGSR